MRGSSNKTTLRWLITCCAALCLVALLPAAAPAATVTNDRPLLFSFDGSDTTAGRFSQPYAIAVDNASGSVYVVNTAGQGQGPGPFDDERVIDKFNAQGEATNFSALGKSSLDGSATPGGAFGAAGPFGFNTDSFQVDLAVDNSGTASQGRIYVQEDGGGPIHAFAPDGSYLWTLPISTASSTGIAVDPDGHLWAVDLTQKPPLAREFDNVGAPPAQIGSVQLTGGESRRLDFDLAGNLYALRTGKSIDKYVGGTFTSAISKTPSRDLVIDQSVPGGHLFSTQELFGETTSRFTELTTTGVQVGSFGSQELGNAWDIAYNPTEDWVYVSNIKYQSKEPPTTSTDLIKVFGPIASGTVPDASTQATSPIGLHSFTANGTLNPQGLPNSYRFDWKSCESVECTSDEDESWGDAESSPLQSIEPTDSSPHAVSLAISKYAGKAIKSNAWYQVRLVGINSESKLANYSAPHVFKTLTPPPAEILSCNTSAVEAESAHLSCTVDPQEEETSWKVMRKALAGATQAQCEALPDGEFQTVKTGTIAAEAPGTVQIEADLTGLLPAQDYCLRATATNPGGSGKKDLSFSTDAIPPSEASAAFAAPRTDTTARLNARINPNGNVAVSYRFEWSEDGSTWTQLPIREATIDARKPVVIADELAGLEPGTTYHFRLALAQNEVGPAASLGEERTFTTRSAAEVAAAGSANCPNADVRSAQHATYLGSCRGLELVNNPDKGNQRALAEGPGWTGHTSPMTADGNKVLWTVTGGAPGGPNGALGNFLATRSADGWHSASVAPPAAQQLGGGDFAYLLTAANPDFTAFLFSARKSTGFAAPPPVTFVRVRDGVHDVLRRSTVQVANSGLEESVDLTEDGEHVLAMDAATQQLEDIGAARVGPPEVPGEVISLMPGGAPSQCGLTLLEGSSFPGFGGGGVGHPGDRWIASTDASRVYFRVQADGKCGGNYGLYVRNRETGKTTLIDPGAGTSASPEFATTTPDGRQGYFGTRSSLDPADTDPGSYDLYLWDEDAGTEGESSCLTCLSPTPAHLAVSEGRLFSVMISKDFSHIYFYSQEKLAPGAVQGALNIYVMSGGQVRFVATTNGDSLRGEAPRLSNDGNVLLFRAVADPSLTADEIPPQCGDFEGGRCQQLYLYDDREESLECISCDHQGATVGHADGSFRLSADGTTAAFVTSGPLLEEDVNDDTDVYEWRNGVQHLLTDGVSDFQEGFSEPAALAVDADGSNILFGVVPPGGSLTGYEEDGVLNIYDARVGGGFFPPPPAEHCEGDSCQGPLTPPPPLGKVASESFSGHGNLSPAKPRRRCAKGKTRRKGRCVKRHQKKQRQKQKRAAKAKHGRAK